METCEISQLYDLDYTIARDLFEGKEYPWEVLSDIGAFILKLGEKLDPEKFDRKGEVSGWQSPRRWRPQPVLTAR